MPNSRWSSVGFTLAVGQPLPLGGGYIGDLNVSAQNWSHTINAFGGFDRAQFSIADALPVLEEWLEEGLGRTITATDDAAVVMWEGIVNQVTLRSAGLEVTRGPLIQIANRVNAIYSTIDTSTNPPTPGERKSTGTLNDTASQARYGILPYNLSLAGATDANAQALRATYLAEHKEPQNDSRFSPADTPPELAVECLGWVHTLIYPYNQTAVSGTINLNVKIQNILSAQLNSGWISTNYGRIAVNTLPVPAYENNDQLALNLIKGLVAMGDINAARYLFGIYEGRQAVYESAGSTLAYEMRLSDPARTVYDAAGAEIYPWRVRPGRWLFYSDFLSGLAPASDFRSDPRMLFVESIGFDLSRGLPNGIQLTGSRVATLPQKLARLGLAGTSG